MASHDVKLLTQEEVAKALRRSVRSVARLRTAGELAWLPGSPIMIPETELSAYLERKIVKRAPSAAPRPPVPSPVPAAKRTPEEQAAGMIENMKRTGQWEGFADLVRRTRGNS
jgi:hypothetical protein